MKTISTQPSADQIVDFPEFGSEKKLILNIMLSVLPKELRVGGAKCERPHHARFRGRQRQTVVLPSSHPVVDIRKGRPLQDLGYQPLPSGYGKTTTFLVHPNEFQKPMSCPSRFHHPNNKPQNNCYDHNIKADIPFFHHQWPKLQLTYPFQ